MAKQLIKVKTVEDGVDGAPPWITTFVDMTSLLVTFFILLFTFSSIQAYDSFTFPKNILGLSGTMEGDASRDMQAPAEDVMSSYDLARGARVPHARPLDQLAENVEEMGQKLDEQHQTLDLNHVGDGLRIRFDTKAGFLPGDARVSSDLAKSLSEAADVLQHYPHLVVIEGFTDDAFRPTTDFPTAEDLALARAEAAAAVLASSGHVGRERLLVTGVGAVPRPDVSGDDALTRKANRRVEIVIQAVSETLAKRLEAQAG